MKKIVSIITLAILTTGAVSGLAAAQEGNGMGMMGRGNRPMMGKPRPPMPGTGMNQGKPEDKRPDNDTQNDGLAVRIGENGATALRGAKVTAVTATTVSATTAWGSTVINWTLNVDSATAIRGKGNGKMAIGDISVGDMIDVRGPLVTTNASLTVQAKEIIDRSAVRPVAQQQTLEGKIKAIAGAAAPTTLTVTVGTTDYQVKVATDTSLLTALWLRTSLANLAVGNTVRVYGAVSGTSIDATVIRTTVR